MYTNQGMTALKTSTKMDALDEKVSWVSDFDESAYFTWIYIRGTRHEAIS